MPSETATSPRRAQIERSLRELVAGLADGDELASETDLARAFGVSRGTIRAAMDRLVSAGLLRRSRGRRTVVHRDVDESAVGFARSPFHLDVRPDNPVVSKTRVRRRPVRPDEAQALGLDPDALITEITRHSTADGHPFGLNTTVFAPWVPVPGNLRHPWASALAKEGIHLVRFVDTVSACAASGPVTNALGVERGAPVLCVRRVAHDDLGRAVEYSVVHLRADSTYVVEQRR